MPTPESKACTKCGETKPPSDYYKQPGCRDGYRPDCKTCVKARVTATRNPERRRELDTQRLSDPDYREKQRERNHVRYLAERDHRVAYAREYYKANPEVYERWRAKRTAQRRGADHQPYSRREVYDRDGGVCKGCGCSLEYKPFGFHIDHIVPISLGGPDIPANVQLMCPGCNRKKRAHLSGQIHFAV